jgi:hypothetical protein
VLLDGINHVAVLTSDTARLVAFDGGVGPTEELNVFQLDEAARQTPMFGASDGFVTDFGPLLSLFFVDPDGLEAEVCIPNPDAVPGVFHPPGTPSRRYHG